MLGNKNDQQIYGDGELQTVGSQALKAFFSDNASAMRVIDRRLLRSHAPPPPWAHVYCPSTQGSDNENIYPASDSIGDDFFVSL